MTKALSELANRLVEMRVERVVMEATSSYWKPVFYCGGRVDGGKAM